MKQIQINGQRLKRALEIAGVTSFMKLSKELGFAESYISCAINRQRIGAPVVMLLEQRFGIKVDDLKDPEPAVTEQMSLDDLDPEQEKLDRLYKMIYQAVYDGVKYAFLDIKKEGVWPQ